MLWSVIRVLVVLPVSFSAQSLLQHFINRPNCFLNITNVRHSEPHDLKKLFKIPDFLPATSFLGDHGSLKFIIAFSILIVFRLVSHTCVYSRLLLPSPVLFPSPPLSLFSLFRDCFTVYVERNSHINSHPIEIRMTSEQLPFTEMIPSNVNVVFPERNSEQKLSNWGDWIS